MHKLIGRGCLPSMLKLYQSRSFGVTTAARQGCPDDSNWIRSEDIETHTGHKFDEDDYRMARFMDRDCKVVNPNIAANLIANIPVIPVDARIVACDGRGIGLRAEGHPRVYINLDRPGAHCCIYCGLRYSKC